MVFMGITLDLPDNAWSEKRPQQRHTYTHDIEQSSRIILIMTLHNVDDPTMSNIKIQCTDQPNDENIMNPGHFDSPIIIPFLAAHTFIHTNYTK